MGRQVAELCTQGYAGSSLAAAVSMEGGEGILTSLSDVTAQVDCVVDFSHHTATAELLGYCVAHRLPVVIATTGQTDAERQMIADAARQIPVFFTANTSVGVAVLADLARRAAAMFPDADIEIVELHHNQKLDVPSGTALMLANAVKQARPDAELVIGRHENGKRTKQEIGIHSLRLGNEVGTHEIYISTGSETLTLRHRAENRVLFAQGALKAAAFLVGKAPGLYTMQDML